LLLLACRSVRAHTPAAAQGSTANSSSTTEAKAILFASPNRDGTGNKSTSALWGDDDDDDDDDEDGLFVAKMSKMVKAAEPTAVAQAVATMGAGGTSNLFNAGDSDTDSDELFE
jgi:hypothetical protein